MDKHLHTGEMGEDIAARYLRGKGLRILQQRVRFGRLELDIVARDGREWVFVEVKTRRGTTQGTAGEAVGAGKKIRFRRAVAEYLRRYGLEREPIRCDFVAIDIDADGIPVIEHFPGGLSW